MECGPSHVVRLIGLIRHKCLDHVVILNERHLRRVLSSHFQYHHDTRNPSLNKGYRPLVAYNFAPEAIFIASPEIGDLHHRYERRAA
jgi:putative transposase